MSDLTRLEQAIAARKKNLAKWREGRVHEMPDALPISGLRVWVRDVTMTDMMFTGRLPEPMVEIMDKMRLSGAKDMDIKEVARSGAEFRQMLDILITLAVVEPPIAEKADDDHMSVDELSGDDKMAIYAWLNREVGQVKSFRDEGEPMEAIQPGGQLWNETERGDAAGD